uniref:Phosphoinositide-3-kinase adaptor protein 1 n=1 Tax=Oryzias latipes TaxID=8090 RepID=A0A3P9K5Z2_ORYLA
MNESMSSTNADDLESKCEVLILYTSEAHEWAMYLQQVLKSHKFHRRSILLYALSSADLLHQYNFVHFQRCKCVVLLLSGVFLDMMHEQNLQRALQGLLQPPHRVVVLFCGVGEEDLPKDAFTDWSSWRKIFAEDEALTYASTIMAAVTDSRQAEAACANEAAAVEPPLAVTAAVEPPLAVSAAVEPPLAVTAAVEPPLAVTAAVEPPLAVSAAVEPPLAVTAAVEPPLAVTAAVEPPLAVTLEDASGEAADPESVHEERSGVEVNPSKQLTCLTVQPSRVQCEKREKLFIVLTAKVGAGGSGPEVEFSSEKGGAKRLGGTVENEYTISVNAPEMPAGLVSLTLYTGQTRLALMPVTYYTCMGEVSRYLEQAADPLTFICQAFNLTSNAAESVDEILNESLKSKMPESGLQLFGVTQIETDNMSANERDEEIPTLLHFAAKYGLKKLTTTLLHCPGALQAYSVMNKHGDYPNTLAEKSGFGDLRRFMDDFVETADMLKSHLEDTVNTDGDVYEAMSNNSQDMMMKYSGSSEDIYESMLKLDPDCAEDLYEAMSTVDVNPEEALLRTFFQAKPQAPGQHAINLNLHSGEEQRDGPLHVEEEEENPYNLCPEDIYDMVDTKSTYNPAIVNRPPAPVPRPESGLDPEKRVTYISRVFSDKDLSRNSTVEAGYPAARPAVEAPASTYDPYAGMKTPGQRQLISLQERVKVGEISVDEAVQEFKAWQFDHERRASSLRYQQENLKKLRDSITRRHKERDKTGKDHYEISAPLQRNLYWSSNLECGVYESSPRFSAPPPPPVHSIQRGSWKTGSTSSTSSTDSNRLSTFSCSSGTEPEFEDAVESLPPRPPRPSDPLPVVPPPRVPPRIPERVPEAVSERYIACPTRALPLRPTSRDRDLAPPVPRRQR